MGTSFGYNRNEGAEDYQAAGALVRLLVETVSRGGNLLLDIGPTADGRVPVIMQDRLLEIGRWLEPNGEAIYGTRAWREARYPVFVIAQPMHACPRRCPSMRPRLRRS